MSSLKSAFAVKAFRDALGAAVRQAQTNPDSILKSLRSDAKPPRGTDATTWLNLVGAVRLAYIAALHEDRADVIRDIRASLGRELSTAEVDQFLTLLSQDDAIDARNTAVLGYDPSARAVDTKNPVGPELFGATGSVEATQRVLVNLPVRPRF